MRDVFMGTAFMKDLLVLCFNIAAGGIRITVCFYLIYRLLSTEKLKKKGVAAAFGGAAVISVLLLMTGLPDFYYMALEASFIAICASRLQNAAVRMCFFIGFFYELAVSLWQFLLAAWLGVLFHSPSFLDYRTGNGQIAVWLLHGLLSALLLFFWKRRNITWKAAFSLASSIAVAGLLAVVTLSEQKTLAIAEDTLGMWMILAVILLAAVLTFNMNRQYEAEKELARLKSEQKELLERDFTALNNAYAMNAKLFHDFHNHIGVLRQLLSRKKLEEAVKYLDELQAPVQEMADTVWTGDETVDYLINHKAAAAKSGKIKFQAQVEFPRHTNLRSADLCAILGNLLDNALEASGKAPDLRQRFVRLTIRRIHQMLVIKVENSFAAKPVEEGHALKTTKEENGLHGWGLKSAKAAAEKYDGMVQTSYTENIFRAVATLSFQGVSIE